MSYRVAYTRLKVYYRQTNRHIHDRQTHQFMNKAIYTIASVAYGWEGAVYIAWLTADRLTNGPTESRVVVYPVLFLLYTAISFAWLS